jgi:hypothetical protein
MLKPSHHLTAVSPFRPASESSTIQGDHGRANPQLLAAHLVVRFAVVSRVGKKAIQTDPLGDLSNNGG